MYLKSIFTTTFRSVASASLSASFFGRDLVLEHSVLHNYLFHMACCVMACMRLCADVGQYCAKLMYQR